MPDKYFVQPCSIVTYTLNEYSDKVYSVIASENCRFREILAIQRQAHSEQSAVDSNDAVSWHPASSAVEKGTIIKIDSDYYQVVKCNEARKLGSTVVQFKKCGLKKIIIPFS